MIISLAGTRLGSKSTISGRFSPRQVSCRGCGTKFAREQNTAFRPRTPIASPRQVSFRGCRIKCVCGHNITFRPGQLHEWVYDRTRILSLINSDMWMGSFARLVLVRAARAPFWADTLTERQVRVETVGRKSVCKKYMTSDPGQVHA